VFVKKDLIKPDSIEYREYQLTIAECAKKDNTLIVLPTGLGKTIIALFLIADKLKNDSEKKILFLAPTKPLVLQHLSFLNKFLTVPLESTAIFTGEVSPKKRRNLWDEKKIIISTPQVIENDLLSRRIDLSDVSLIIFDEAHHAIGRYAYVFINDRYQRQQKNPHVFAMTASPGNDIEKITEVCKNLTINHVEIRSKHDADVREYVHDINFSWRHVSIPSDFSFGVDLLKKALRKRLKELKEISVIESASVSSITKTKLLDAQKRIQAKIRSELHPPKRLFTAARMQSEAIKLLYAIEIFQTQGVKAVRQFLSRIDDESKKKSGSKSSKALASDPLFIETKIFLSKLTLEHPKLAEVQAIISDYFKKNPSSRVIIFTHYRDTSKMVYEQLIDIDGVKPVRFIGQGSKVNDKGLTQKQQREIVNKFRRGVFNVLIATSVAEEGLDIPATELVIFYEPIPSEIRNIQRRGRTARNRPGKVIILITKGTPDEGYYWASKRKEKLMRSELELMRASLKRQLEFGTGKNLLKSTVKEDQKTLIDYSDKKQNSLKITVDNREYRSLVVRSLNELDVEVEPAQLEVGDYQISNRVGVERKEVDDFLNSLINGTLFRQVKFLRDAFPRPVLIIEGDGLFTKRNMSHQAIYGAMVSIIIDYGVSIISTKNGQDTAELLLVMAKREHGSEKKTYSLRSEKHSMNISDQQQFIIEGLPQISSVMAKRLLDHFESIRALMNASEDELMEVKGVGKNIAQRIVHILNEPFERNP